MEIPNLLINALFVNTQAEVPNAVAVNLVRKLFDKGLEEAVEYYRQLEKPEFHKRWVGPRHAKGKPDAKAGESYRAWTSLNGDDPDEWLSLTYPSATKSTAVKIYQNFNPGAIAQVSVGSGDEMKNLDLKSAIKYVSDKGVSILEIPIPNEMLVERVLVELDSPKVKGWNQIDAVGLKSIDGSIIWANDATESSTAAGNAEPNLFIVPVAADLMAWRKRYQQQGYYREADLIKALVNDYL
ncbi:MAG: hypothetical protein ACJAVV_003789 [Alphaproteobacteria bacterium]|jgi:hypothetical protein